MPGQSPVVVHQLKERDLPEADRVYRLAFGTIFGLADPMTFAGDADIIATRWRADPGRTLGAYVDDALVGSNILSNWGSFGYFGPLTVRPDFWDKGIAQQLLGPTMEHFTRWGTRLAALFTIPESTKHIALYQKFGFWPQYLTPLMAKPIDSVNRVGATFSDVPPANREATLAECLAITDAIYDGLDVTSEIRAVETQRLGETVLVRDGHGEVAAFVVCHIGKGTEGGTGICYVKFGAARPGVNAQRDFDRLLSDMESIAARRGAAKILAGVNTARDYAYRYMLGRGYRALRHGVAMQRPNDAGFNRTDCFVMDDWR